MPTDLSGANCCMVNDRYLLRIIGNVLLLGGGEAGQKGHKFGAFQVTVLKSCVKKRECTPIWSVNALLIRK